MNSPKTIVPRSESKKLLSLPTREAEQLFQSYEKQHQLEILSATRNPKSREQLYYLVPDCTELIQESPTEDVLQVLDTMLGTGLASVLLPCLSNDQFEELLDIAVWRDGKLDEASLDLGSLNFLNVNATNSGGFLENLTFGYSRPSSMDASKSKMNTSACFLKPGFWIRLHQSLIMPTNALGQFPTLSGKRTMRYLRCSSANSSLLIPKGTWTKNLPLFSMPHRQREPNVSLNAIKRQALT